MVLCFLFEPIIGLRGGLYKIFLATSDVCSAAIIEWRPSRSFTIFCWKTAMKFPSISRINQLVESAVSRTVRIPYAGVAHDPESYLAQTSTAYIVKKYLHKYLRLRLSNQLSLERQQVPKNAKILWVYTGKRNFGDANMDIAGRALLKDRGCNIDLFTLPNLHELFGQDDIFGNVYSNLEDVLNKQYDFILLSEYNLPSIRFKTKYFRKLPFACLFGFFLGPARNQTCFSYAAINHLFDLKLTLSEIIKVAKPYLNSHEEVARSVADLIPGEPFLTVSIGGRDADRSYRHWPAFLKLLDQSNNSEIPKSIILLGSDNGLEMEALIKREKFSNLKIHSCVAQLSLLQSREIISRSRVFIGCDGGLMHVAHSTRTPSVTLFRAQEPYRLWLTESCHSSPIQSPGEDSDIDPSQIFSQLQASLQQFKGQGSVK
jgi:ADP-heptose:LPS heptosyltransferase